MGIEKPQRTSKSAIFIGSVLIVYSLALAISVVGFVLEAHSNLFLKLFVLLIGAPLIVSLTVISIGFIKARIPRTLEDVEKEYEEVLKEVKKAIEGGG